MNTLGMKTLWGSFEIPYVRLIKKMLRQVHGDEIQPHQINQAFEKFQKLPISFMDYHGSLNVLLLLLLLLFLVNRVGGINHRLFNDIHKIDRRVPSNSSLFCHRKKHSACYLGQSSIYDVRNIDQGGSE